LARGEPGEGFATCITWSWKMIVPSVSLARLERRVLVGDLVGGVFALALAALDVGLTAPPGSARTHDRDLDREVLQIHRPGAKQRLHLRAALDLEHADVSAWRIALNVAGSSNGIRDRSTRWCARARSPPRSARPREHAEPEQVDLQEPGVAQESLSTAPSPSLHRAGTTGQQSIRGRVAMIIPPECLTGAWQPWAC